MADCQLGSCVLDKNAMNRVTEYTMCIKLHGVVSTHGHDTL